MNKSELEAKVLKNWSSYPVGTRAYAIGGGYWLKVFTGWKWNGGATFPKPGGDVSHVQLPEIKQD